MTRKNPNYKQKLAALICAHFNIPREHQRIMSVEQILSLTNWDHDPVPYATARDLGWTPDQYNHPSNLTGRLKKDHDWKTAKIDVPRIAKGKRITKEHLEFQSRILAKSGQGNANAPDPTKPKSKWPAARKMLSRPFQKKAART